MERRQIFVIMAIRRKTERQLHLVHLLPMQCDFWSFFEMKKPQTLRSFWTGTESRHVLLDALTHFLLIETARHDHHRVARIVETLLESHEFFSPYPRHGLLGTGDIPPELMSGEHRALKKIFNMHEWVFLIHFYLLHNHLAL